MLLLLRNNAVYDGALHGGKKLLPSSEGKGDSSGGDNSSGNNSGGNNSSGKNSEGNNSG